MSETSVRPAVRVYWIPGCGNCVRLKGRLADLGVEYQAINVQAASLDPAESKRLTEVGIPAVGIGDTFVTGLDFNSVESALGIATAGRHGLIPAAELVDRAVRLMHAAADLAAQMPAEHRGDPIPGMSGAIIPAIFLRDGTPYIPHRTHGELIGHIVGHAEKFTAFLAGIADQRDLSFALTQGEFSAYGEPASGAEFDVIVSLLHELADHAQAQRARAVPPADSHRLVDTYFGPHSAHELAQLMTCSLAQHTRQLIALVEEYGSSPAAGLYSDDHMRLGLPARVWD
jgi:glutaredoxin